MDTLLLHLTYMAYNIWDRYPLTDLLKTMKLLYTDVWLVGNTLLTDKKRNLIINCDSNAILGKLDGHDGELHFKNSDMEIDYRMDFKVKDWDRMIIQLEAIWDKPVTTYIDSGWKELSEHEVRMEELGLNVDGTFRS